MNANGSMLIRLPKENKPPKPRRPLGVLFSLITMTLFLSSALLFFSTIGGSVAVASNKIETPNKPEYHVGYRILDFEYPNEKNDGPLTVGLWYPTESKPTSFHYAGMTSGMVKVNAPPLKLDKPLPLLVFSHGYSGSGLASVFINEYLASLGWIVVAPDHHDKQVVVRLRSSQKKSLNKKEYLRSILDIPATSPATRHKYYYRLDEMKVVLDRILTHDTFAKLIDKNRVAVGGHSLGGFTALGMCGTIEKYHDTRIKAVLLYSTGLCGYFFTREELKKVHIPSMLFSGAKERHRKRRETTMAELNQTIFNSLPAPKYYLEVKGAGHLSFNNRITRGFMARFRGGSEDRFDVIRSYSTAFLEKYVAGKYNTDHVLNEANPMITYFTKNRFEASGL